MLGEAISSSVESNVMLDESDSDILKSESENCGSIHGSQSQLSVQFPSR